jgi:hypothetical protein
MIQRFKLPVFIFLMLLLAACAPATSAPDVTPAPTLVATTQIPSQAPQGMATENPVPATDQPAPVMVATSRGPNLEASDPAFVNLASGQLQLVEFFRFT